ncbi:NinG protein [Pedobacter sp. HDW13]|uniref:recombination protein NinG n=1 Tax=Pedobacter sp. HDW13 TaxID=2714940 RepID=UPI001409F335|nr:recombination protein NinG [Pedobacter sp. HDW13]QIL41012.1 NinG protein [Pedobacter sp. HDW13]
MNAKETQKYQKKPVPALIKLATEYFNRYVRNRDAVNGRVKCISCSTLVPLLGVHAGHYRASTFAATRFDERNVNGQCARCNTHLHGNLIDYRINLIDKIGLEEVEDIEMISRMPSKWDRFDLIDIIIKYKAKCKEFE